MIKQIFKFIFIGIIILVAILFGKTYLTNKKNNPDFEVSVPSLPKSALQHFQSAIQIKTISFANPKDWDSIPFLEFRNFLANTYPLFHQNTKLEIIGGYSLVYTWEGKNKNLNPFILMAHQDVVPIEETTIKQWNVEPFSGIVKDGYIWGRGTTDDKINLIGMLEAAEKLMQQKIQPERTIYFVFGHDEELGGKHGALQIAKLFESRNIKADLVLDEGGIVSTQKIPGINKPLALIGTAEKGYMSLELSVFKNGGHSSMPENETAIDILMNALVKLHQQPFKPKFEGSTEMFIDFLGPEMSFPYNIIFTNSWLFKPLIIKNFEKSATTNAMMRTTSVTTIFKSGIKDNVIPSIACATINYRLLPGDSGKQIIQMVQKVINDTLVKIKIKDNHIGEGTKSSDVNGIGFKLINNTIQKTVKDVITTPFLLIGGTDSKHFENISDNIIKFSPMTDPIGFHGINERVSIESFRNNIWFFQQLMSSK
jgi:carboxypeptidase PM20D1